jgi:two-component system, OmpR family, sensor histidine kinase VicK
VDCPYPGILHLNFQDRGNILPYIPDIGNNCEPHVTSIAGSEKTEVVYGTLNVLNAEIQFLSNARLKVDTCMDYRLPSLALRIESKRKSFLDAKGRDVKFRYITEIRRENIRYCKELMKIAEVRHLDGIKGNFMVSEKEYLAPAVSNNTFNIASQIIYSNLHEIVKQQQYMFETLWSKATVSEQRIREIEDAKVRIKAIEEVDSEGIEIIQVPVDIQKLVFSLIQRAKEEILVMYSTSNAFHRQERVGKIQSLKEAAKERGVKVRILTPQDELILETARKLMMVQEGGQQAHENIGIRYIQPHLQIKVTIIIVDRKYSLAIELKDDTKQASIEAIGLATYSNSQSTVLSYVSIFESLWTQTELYQKLKESEKVKDDFVRIAAHELRTPIQPILGLTQILRSKIKDNQQQQFLDTILRNAKRLQRLTQDILDVSKIETKSLDLKKELFNLNEMILSTIADSNNYVAKEWKDNLKLEFIGPKENIFIEADKGRINQVISNLLNNAIRFTNEGIITAAAVPKNDGIVVSISDTGSGIDSEILPILFTKFATKSTMGTGLGLFISKSIIDAHGGKIWGKNNYPEGKGATFGFSLPYHNQRFV